MNEMFREGYAMNVMKAALYDGQAMQVGEVPVPCVMPEAVIVRVRAAGICGSELNYFRSVDRLQERPSGHEVAGEIVEIGPGVDGWSIGDRVALDTICQGRACGKCRYCLAGQHFHCLNPTSFGGGGFAEYIQRKAMGSHRLPDKLSWAEGALVEPLAVGVHGLRKGQLRGGENVIVLGCGTIGLSAVAAARSLGANQVLATARHPHQGEMALKLGANAIFSPDDQNLGQAVADATEGQGVDMVVEAVGGYAGETARQAIQVCRRLGRIILIGAFHRPVELNLGALLAKERDLITANCYSIADQRHDFDVAIDILASGRLPLRDMVTHTFALDDARVALETAYDKSTHCIKVQLVP
jgi:threonine dehydrogenase-like Zn-dependent dehydrogenase